MLPYSRMKYTNVPTTIKNICAKIITFEYTLSCFHDFFAIISSHTIKPNPPMATSIASVQSTKRIESTIAPNNSIIPVICKTCFASLTIPSRLSVPIVCAISILFLSPICRFETINTIQSIVINPKPPS